MRKHITLAVALIASLLACGAPNDASDPASPNNSVAGDRGSSTASTSIGGAVSALTGSCPAVTFALEGKAIAASASTHYDGGACSDLKNGVRVKVAGATQANGSIAAQTIGFAAPVTTPPTDPKTPTPSTAAVKGTVSEVAGTCPVVSLKVEGRPIATTATTRYEGGACIDVKNGALISVTGIVQADRSIVAQSIGIASATPVEPPRPKDPPTATPSTASVKGTASEVAGTCPVISLKLEGKTIRTTATTRYEGSACIDVKNGARMSVTGTVQADGSIEAIVISVAR